MTIDWMIWLLAVALISQIGARLVTRYAVSRQLLDVPGERRPHERPTPRGGGLGLSLAVLIAVGIGWFQAYGSGNLSWLVAASALLLGLIGWLDDSRGLGILSRLVVQATLALSVTLLLPPLQTVSLMGLGLPLLLVQMMVVFGLIWSTNLYNFMDGSHGLATTQAIFAGLLLSLGFYQAEHSTGFWCAAALTAAAVGFLPLNFPRPRVFLGDSGSTVMGFLLGLLSWEGLRTDAFGPVLPLLALAPFLMDANLTLLNRVFRGQQWYNAHTEHAYQRLLALGLTHSKVWLVFQGVNALALVLFLGIKAEKLPIAATIIGFYGLLLVLWLMVYRRSRQQ